MVVAGPGTFFQEDSTHTPGYGASTEAVVAVAYLVPLFLLAFGVSVLFVVPVTPLLKISLSHLEIWPFLCCSGIFLHLR